LADTGAATGSRSPAKASDAIGIRAANISNMQQASVSAATIHGRLGIKPSDDVRGRLM
jgi:hypothetical protein